MPYDGQLQLGIVADDPELDRCAKTFKEMYESQELVDVQIKTPAWGGPETATVGNGLWAHKVVLSAVSPVLRRMLTGSFKESKGNEILLQEVNARIVRSFLDFIYTGQTQVSSLSELLELGKLADLLQVLSLRDLVLDTARDQLSASSCALLLQTGKDCGLRKVEEMALEYAVQNVDEVASTGAFLGLDEEVVGELLSSAYVSCSEEALFEHTLRWMTEGRADAALEEGRAEEEERRNAGSEATRRGRQGAEGEQGEGETETEGRESAVQKEHEEEVGGKAGGQEGGKKGGKRGAGARGREGKRERRLEEAGWRIRGEELLRRIRFPVMDGQYLALQVHQRHALLAQSALLNELATEAALWQLVPNESKHLFQLCSLSPDVLQQRQGRWDVGGSVVRQVLRGQAEEVQALTVYKGMLLSGSVDSSIWVWNTQSWKCERKLLRHQGAVCALEISDRLLFSGSVDCTICVWDMLTWCCIDVLQGHTKSVFCLKATKNVLLSGGDDCTIRVWHLRTSEVGAETGSSSVVKTVLDGCRTLSDHTKAVCALEASGRRAFSGSFDQTIRVWDTTAWTCLRVLTGHESGICTMIVAGDWLISGSVDILVWNLNDLSRHCSLPGHNGGVNELAVVGKKVLGAFDDKLIRVWNVHTWQLERTIEGHVGAVYALAIDSSKLYTASYDRCIRAWY